MDKEILKAYYWLYDLEVKSEEEATNKEIILSLLDEYKFNDYFENQRRLENWKK